VLPASYARRRERRRRLGQGNTLFRVFLTRCPFHTGSRLIHSVLRPTRPNDTFTRLKPNLGSQPAQLVPSVFSYWPMSRDNKHYVIGLSTTRCAREALDRQTLDSIPATTFLLRASLFPRDLIRTKMTDTIEKINIDNIETRIYSGSRTNLLIMINTTRNQRAGLILHLLTSGLIPSLLMSIS
jgi:hypothetical protein